MQIETPGRYHFTPTGLAVPKRQTIPGVGENPRAWLVGMGHAWKTVRQLLGKVNVESPEGLAILPLSVGPEETKPTSTQKLECTCPQQLCSEDLRGGNSPSVY